jgi:K+-sensing histidine kinase KdpD
MNGDTIMNIAPILTQYAPAERATAEELNRQIKLFKSTPLQGEVLDAVPSVVVILNTNRQIIFANRALNDLMIVFGKGPALGKRPGEALHCIHATETEGGCGTTEFCRTCGAVHAILNSMQGNANEQECFISRDADLDPLELSVSATPLTIYNDKFTVFALTDISHEKRRRKLERIFFHDVLNTVGGLSGYLEIMEDIDPEDQKEHLVTMGFLMQKLIDEIKTQRDLVSAENNEMKAISTALDSFSFIQQQCEFYRRHAVTENRTLSIDPKAQHFTFASDATILGRVLGNMIKNALEASPENGNVTVGCLQRGEQVEFWVHNNAYIMRDVQLQMFQRSFSTKGSNRGLGTYSIKLLSERYLKGKVSFTSTQEEGTTFRVTLPLTLKSDKIAA